MSHVDPGNAELLKEHSGNGLFGLVAEAAGNAELNLKVAGLHREIFKDFLKDSLECDLIDRVFVNLAGGDHRMTKFGS